MKKFVGVAKKLRGVAAGGYSFGDIWFGHFLFGLENSELGLGVCGPILTTLLLTSKVKRTLLVGALGGVAAPGAIVWVKFSASGLTPLERPEKKKIETLC